MQRDLHRPARQQRQRGDQRLELDVELGAEAAAEIRHFHAHPVLRPAEQARDLDAHEGRGLRRGVDGEPAVVGIRNRDERLERQVQHLLGAEHVLEHMIGFGEGLVDIAAPQLVIERDIGVAGGPCRCLRSGNVPAGLSTSCTIAGRGHRLDLVEDRRQFLVIGDDQLCRRLGDMRVCGQHHGDRLADKMHLVDREDRLIVEGRAVDTAPA